MKSIHYIPCLLVSLSVATAAMATTEAPYHRPLPPKNCIIKNPKHVYIDMHGAYLIEV